MTEQSCEEANSVCTWRSPVDEDYSCKLIALPGELGTCILHHTDKQDSEIESFWDILKEQINSKLPNPNFNAQHDFTGYTFPGSVTIQLGGSDPGTAGTILLDGPEYVVLNECTVKGNLRIRFKGGNRRTHILLHNADIKGNLILANAKLGSVGMRHTKVGGLVDFRNTLVQGSVDCSKSDISGDLIMSGAAVGGALQAGEAHVGGGLFLRQTLVCGALDFREMCITKTVSFVGTRLKGLVRFRGCEMGAISLGDTAPRLVGVGRCGIAKPGNYATGHEFWRLARNAFTAADNREMADIAYYYERVWKWRAGWIKKRTETRLRYALRLPFYAFGYVLDLFFLRMASAYGASFYRLVGSWAGVVLAFSGIFYGLKLLGGPVLEDVATFGRALYFSMVTFTTLGLGDVSPKPGWGSALTALEATIGVALISTTILVLGRKFLRD